MKEKERKIYVSMILIMLILYLNIVSIIQRFKQPKMTSTELLIALPKNAILKFK